LFTSSFTSWFAGSSDELDPVESELVDSVESLELVDSVDSVESVESVDSVDSVDSVESLVLVDEVESVETAAAGRLLPAGCSAVAPSARRLNVSAAIAATASPVSPAATNRPLEIPCI
jgi:hypothetical protein